MQNLPSVTKNILLITFLCWLADVALQRYGIQLTAWLGLWHYASPHFHFWQPLTYMFMHANLSHIICNMFAVFMFAPAIEHCWGSKRFLIFYLVSGLGAALVQQIVWTLMGHTYGVTIGASGAVFGILFAFAWLFPDVKMFVLFIPVPIRARLFVLIYAAIELFAGLAPIQGDHVAHFAHLGGLLFGWLLIIWWRFWDNHRSHMRSKDKDSDYTDYHYHASV